MLAVSAVFINGFDFGTTEDAIEAHMGQAGTVVAVDLKKGSAVVTYSTADEARSAVSSLNKSTIAGNSRFIDVQLDKKSMPADSGNKRGLGGESNWQGGSPKVLVDGFDFGTTDEQLLAHMGKVGTVVEVHWVGKGSANVVYSSASEATAAIQQLNRTTIDGNSRFIDVIPGGDRAVEAKRFKGGFESWGGKGKGAGKAFILGWGGKGKGGCKGGKGGKGGKHGDHSDEDPAGSGRVFVRGFDFGTTDEQLEGHMSQAGPIHKIHWVNQGNAVVVYRQKASAMRAVSTLENSTIPGNSRYINVSERS
eukprot:TRINITY_DN2843_c0_g1_i1.p1 TRINITY_DN2843_c0_g1~~TRINITY_DN2843_c0_g1_i1.p1  ORF type:complete len:307 (+),score=60.64 TRINITY_DN2843_c0_g1_i1:50-970(+)